MDLAGEFRVRAEQCLALSREAATVEIALALGQHGPALVQPRSALRIAGGGAYQI